MSNKSNTQEKIKDLQAQIAALQEEELSALRDRRAILSNEINAIDAEIARITGKTTDKKSAAGERKSFGKSIPLQELKELIANAPDKTLSVRKEGLDLSNIRTLANANPQLLRMGGKGAWPTVTLLK